MLMCRDHNICFSLRFNEKRDARHVRTWLFFKRLHEGHSVIYLYVLVMQCVSLLQKGLGMRAEDVRHLDCSNVS